MFKKQQKITMVALIGIGLFNPFTVAVLDEYFKLFYTGVFIACVVWVSGFILKQAFTPEKVNVPKKNKKSTKPAFIET